MNSKSRKTKPTPAAESTATPAPAAESTESVDLSQFTKRKPPPESLHLNLRFTGEVAEIYKFLEKQTPTITDSLRIRDCVRVTSLLYALKLKNEPVMILMDGRMQDVFEYVGAFYPETPMDTRRRPVREPDEAGAAAPAGSRRAARAATSSSQDK